MKQYVVIAAILALLGVPSASAVNVRVSSQTIGQGYQLITSSGDILKRSRLNQLLGLNVYDISGDGKLSFVSQFRFDSDFGITSAESSSIEQLKNNNLSIMYGYFQMKGIADVLDLRLGRQLIIDDMDFTMMDGLRVNYHTPFNVGVEVLGGIEVKNAFLGMLSSTQLESDGDGGAYSDNDQGGPDEEMSLVVGGGLILEGLKNHHGKLGYRRIMTTDNQVDAEKVFANYHYRIHPKFHVATSTAWDFVIGDISEARAELRSPGIADVMDISLAYWRLVPTFEGSSIFNVFSTQPLNDVDFRMRFHMSKTASTYVGGYLRMFGNDKEENFEEAEVAGETLKDIGVRAGGRMALGRRGRLQLDASHQQGYGDMTVIDFSGGYNFLDNRLSLSGRVTTVTFEDPIQENLSATSFGAQVGVSYLVRRIARFHLMNEVNTSRIESLQYRVFALVDLELWL